MSILRMQLKFVASGTWFSRPR